MFWHREGDYGSVREILSPPDGQGTRVTRKFLSSIAINFATWNTGFWEYTNFFPVIFRERQIAGGIFKAIFDSGAQVLPEPSIKRKRWGAPETTGWADFIAYLDDTTWFFEIKHTHWRLDYLNNRQSEGLKAEWNDANKKIKSIRRTAINDWASQGHTVFRVALHTVLVYQEHKMKKKVQPVNEWRVVDNIRLLNPYLNPKPNWIWIWSLHHRLQEAQQFVTKWENYPAVYFLAYVIPPKFKVRSVTK